MMQPLLRLPAKLAALSVALGTLGCATVEPVLGDRSGTRGRTSVVHGEVRSVDTRANRIQLRADRGGNQTVRYDSRTRVVYNNRSYPVSALERGDIITARVSYDRNGRAVANRLEVHSSVRDRGRGSSAPGRSTARVERLDGTVTRVDSRAGAFTLAAGRGPPVAVYAPRNLSRNDRARLDRLRRGDRVRVDVRAVSRNRFELVRFR